MVILVYNRKNIVADKSSNTVTNKLKTPSQTNLIASLRSVIVI